jgi:hypothetical protein
MNRTKKLMRSVTASVLLIAPSRYHEVARDNVNDKDNSTAVESDGVAWPISGVSLAAVQNSASKEGLEVKKAAEAVLERLKDKRISDAKSLDVLTKELPMFDRHTVEEALDMLRDQGKIQRTGSGTKDDPYRYYGRTEHGN